jgi:excinuclease UvrABC nuclease subunit
MSRSELQTVIANLEQEMLDLAAKLEFEKAAEIRDTIKALKGAKK